MTLSKHVHVLLVSFGQKKHVKVPGKSAEVLMVQFVREDKLGRTPLHNAVAAGCDELAKGLLEEKAWRSSEISGADFSMTWLDF